jgi:hypothetical protein
MLSKVEVSKGVFVINIPVSVDLWLKTGEDWGGSEKPRNFTLP